MWNHNFHGVDKAGNLLARRQFRLHAGLSAKGFPDNTVTTVALGQRKRNCTMTLPAILTGKYGEHIDWIGIDFFDEDTLMAISAIQPLGMRLMRKHDERQLTGLIHDDIHIEDLDLCFREYIGARFDISFSQCPDPGNPVAGAIRRQ